MEEKVADTTETTAAESNGTKRARREMWAADYLSRAVNSLEKASDGFKSEGDDKAHRDTAQLARTARKIQSYLAYTQKQAELEELRKKLGL